MKTTEIDHLQALIKYLLDHNNYYKDFKKYLKNQGIKTSDAAYQLADDYFCNIDYLSINLYLDLIAQTMEQNKDLNFHNLMQYIYDNEYFL